MMPMPMRHEHDSYLQHGWVADWCCPVAPRRRFAQCHGKHRSEISSLVSERHVPPTGSSRTYHDENVIASRHNIEISCLLCNPQVHAAQRPYLGIILYHL